MCEVRQYDDELVPTLPGHRVRAPDAHAQFAADGPKQVVAHDVPERVVDVFEPIDIQEEDG